MYCMMDALNGLVHLNGRDKQFVKDIIEKNKKKDGFPFKDYPKLGHKFNLIFIKDGQYNVQPNGVVHFFNNSKRKDIYVQRGKHFIAIQETGWGFWKRDHAMCMTADKLNKDKKYTGFFIRR